MDDTAQDTGEHDAFAQLLAQLNAPTTEPVAAPIVTGAAITIPPEVRAGHPAPPIDPIAFASTSIDAEFPSPYAPSGPATRAPELRGADELAAEPRPFPPLPVAATPLIAPPLPPTAAPAPAPPPAAPPPFSAPPDAFALLLTAPASSPSSAPTPGPRSALGLGATAPDEPDIARSTVGEKLILLLAILLPPLGLLAALVAAIRSAHRRGWVIGLLRAALAIGVVLTVVAGIGGYIGYSALQQQRAHDRTAAASAAFCSTITADRTMIQSPTFGWPAVATTITDSLAAMQKYEDKWTKLAKVSPAGIRSEVTKVAVSAKQIINSVTVGRTVDDAANISVMTQTAAASGVPGWYAEYCN